MAGYRCTEQDFWAKMNVGDPDDCWPWLRATDRNGFGLVRWHGRMRPAYHVAYEITNGVLLDSLTKRRKERKWVRQSCNNHGCGNPAHIFLGARRCSHTMATKRGAEAPTAKLTDADVIIMRYRRAAGELIKVIAWDFRICDHAASKAIRGLTWAHVPHPNMTPSSR